MANWPYDVDKRVLTFEEAVVGVEDCVEFGSINRASSCGYPWNNDSDFGSNKHKLFGIEQEFNLLTPGAIRLKKSVDNMIDLARKGERSSVIFADCLKDERRPKEKVDMGKTRLFSACPIDYLVAFRQYFGSFSIFYVKNRIRNSSAIGVNPYSLEWNTIALELQKKAQGKARCGAGDYSHYDGSELSSIHNDILEIINEWYDDGNEIIRETLWKELTNSVHIRENYVYEWDGSLPSGHPFTAVVNTMYNNLLFRMCWLQVNGMSHSSMKLFDQNVFLICLGDDNLYAVADPYDKVFDEFRLAEEMKQLGMVYTSEIKGEVKHGLRLLTEVEFLKRRFEFDDIVCRYVAPLRMETILEMPQWSKKGEKYEEITTSNVQNALDELTLHGKDVYQQWSPKLLGAYYSNGYREIITRTRFDINHEFVLSRQDYAGNVTTITPNC
nr:non-structural polyprotein [Flumine dicistrovirus 44]